MAFSIAPISDGSNGCATISAGSGIDSVGHLVDRHLGAVGLDVDAVEQADRGAAGADVRHVPADALDGGVHPRLDLAEHAFQIVEIHMR